MNKLNCTRTLKYIIFFLIILYTQNVIWCAGFKSHHLQDNLLFLTRLRPIFVMLHATFTIYTGDSYTKQNPTFYLNVLSLTNSEQQYLLHSDIVRHRIQLKSVFSWYTEYCCMVQYQSPKYALLFSLDNITHATIIP